MAGCQFTAAARSATPPSGDRVAIGVRLNRKNTTNLDAIAVATPPTEAGHVDRAPTRRSTDDL
jgi:hypothetical protein